MTEPSHEHRGWSALDWLVLVVATALVTLMAEMLWRDYRRKHPRIDIPDSPADLVSDERPA